MSACSFVTSAVQDLQLHQPPPQPLFSIAPPHQPLFELPPLHPSKSQSLPVTPRQRRRSKAEEILAKADDAINKSQGGSEEGSHGSIPSQQSSPLFAIASVPPQQSSPLFSISPPPAPQQPQEQEQGKEQKESIMEDLHIIDYSLQFINELLRNMLDV